MIGRGDQTGGMPLCPTSERMSKVPRSRAGKGIIWQDSRLPFGLLSAPWYQPSVNRGLKIIACLDNMLIVVEKRELSVVQAVLVKSTGESQEFLETLAPTQRLNSVPGMYSAEVCLSVPRDFESITEWRVNSQQTTIAFCKAQALPPGELTKYNRITVRSLWQISTEENQSPVLG